MSPKVMQVLRMSLTKIYLKGAGGMKLAVSCFSSNHVNFSPIRVGLCYSGCSRTKLNLTF